MKYVIKVIFSCFHFFDVATGNFKITYMASNILLDSAGLDLIRRYLLEKAFPGHPGQVQRLPGFS